MLPPSRKLALEWQVSRGTIVAATEILCAEEVLIAKRGSGIYVSHQTDHLFESKSAVSEETIISPPDIVTPAIDKTHKTGIDLRPCRPSIELLAKSGWKRCVANASIHSLSPDVANPQGLDELRVQIAEYLRKSRGLQTQPDQIFISLGIVHAVQLISRLYLRPGSKVVMEDPGYILIKQMFELAGVDVIACPVDEDGLVVDMLPECGKDISLIYVTPSHQFPIGSRLSSARRAALIEWAMKNRVIVLEDDYDGEFRHDVASLPPLASFPNECVAYLGTFSKTMYPDIRVGYVIAQTPVINALSRYRAIHEYGIGTVMQYALSRFISSGQFEKYLAQMRKLYRRKRLAVKKYVRQSNIPGELIGLDSGLHSVLKMSQEINVEYLSERARIQGLLITPVSKYATNIASSPNGLVLGYAEPSVNHICSALALIDELCQN